MTADGALRAASDRLAQVGLSARLDAEVLLAHVLGCSRGSLLARGERALDGRARRSFDALVARRAAGEPVAYLTGEKEFWSLPLKVTPEVLIPRPETELLVEWGLQILSSQGKPESRASVLDLGTGSGAIALALAKEHSGISVVATDVSPRALDVARCNAERLAICNLEFLEGDLFEALGAGGRANGSPRFDLIVSNPPYVAAGDPHLASLGFEPCDALVSGRDGLDALRAIVAGAPARLERDGWLILEHGTGQGAAVRGLLHDAGFTRVETRRDLAGHERATGGQRP